MPTELLVPNGVEEPSSQPNFLKEIIDEFLKERKGESFTGAELKQIITEKLIDAGVRVPYLVDIALKIAILRDNMIGIDSSIIQKIIKELLANATIVEFLKKPSVRAALATREGMDEITDRLMNIILGTPDHAAPESRKKIGGK